MPALEEHTQHLQWLSAQERTVYAGLKGQAGRESSGSDARGELLANVMKLRQACNHPSLAHSAEQEDEFEAAPSQDFGGGGGGAAAAAAAASDGGARRDHHMELGDSDSDSSDESSNGRQQLPGAKLTGAKLEALDRLLREAQQAGEKVLVFSFFKRFLDLIAVRFEQLLRAVVVVLVPPHSRAPTSFAIVRVRSSRL
jgi:SNF2 family DNA or RNA helicase